MGSALSQNAGPVRKRKTFEAVKAEEYKVHKIKPPAEKQPK